jgi:hypothetical protein
MLEVALSTRYELLMYHLRSVSLSNDTPGVNDAVKHVWLQ